MSTSHAITFDFHDTFASCDRWFDLEVRLLPSEVLTRLPAVSGADGRSPNPDDATAAYRSLRGEIIEHGLEMDALAGVLETFRRVDISVDERSTAAVIDDLMRESLTDVRPKPGAVDTVRALHAAGFSLGVVSSAVYHPFLLWALEAFAVLPLFGTVVTSASAGFYKSRPEIYQRALADLDVPPEHACHVGDSFRWDHLTPRAIGMRTVLVRPDPAAHEEGQPEPDLHLPSLVDAAPSIVTAAASWWPEYRTS